MVNQVGNEATINRPKFVWFLVITYGFVVSFEVLIYLIWFFDLLRLNLAQNFVIKDITLFDYTFSLLIALLNFGGSVALFNFKPIAPKLFLTGLMLSIAQSIWNLSTKPGLHSLKSGTGLFTYIVLYGFVTYVVYYAYWMKKQGFLRRRTRASLHSQSSQQLAHSSPQLPCAPDWLFSNIAEAGKAASKIYTGFFGLLVYCALTVVSTNDRQILFDEPARLPLVNLGVPLIGFFVLSPVLMLVVFIYLQVYLHRIKGLITQLRTKYAPIEDRRLYPWMLTIAEEPEPGLIGRLQKGIVTASLWWSLPIVLFLFPIWFTKKHDPIFSYVVGIVPLIGLWLVVWFWHTYDPCRKRGRAALATVGSVVSALILLLIIPLSNAGIFTKGITNITLNHEVLVTKPDQDYESLYWVDLHEAHLEAAQLNYSVLSRANLKGAVLRFSNLVSAKIDKADLSNANLQYAGLIYAQMEGAILAEARLDRANLSRTKLETANFYKAQLEGSKLVEANLGKANFTGANLEKADLRFAHAEAASFGQARLNGANLGHAQFRGAALREAHLEEALLTCANLREADLLDAHLEGADLSRANLLGARNLVISQLAEAKSIFMAELDLSVLKAIKKDYPILWRAHESAEENSSGDCIHDPPPNFCDVCGVF